MTVTIGELKGYWRKVADAVSNNKMNVTDADILAALMAIGQTIEDVEAEIQAIKSTEGIKKIADTVDVKLTGSNMEYYGATSASRPAANSVPVGAYFMAVQTQEIWQSDGTNWVVIRGA